MLNPKTNVGKLTRQDKAKHFILSVHKYGNMRNDKYRYTKEANMCNDNIV